MPYTGGPLNELNGKMGISAPYKSVPVMKLIRTHKPKTRDELYELIKSHYINDCSCGIKSQGTIEDFGKNLYESQKSYWGEIKFTLQQCIQWEYDLFISQSLKGNQIENKAIKYLNQNLTNYNFEGAEGYIDEELRVDILISKSEVIIAGLQVKPLTFNLMRQGVIDFNKSANLKWGKPVLYLFYNDNEEFTNINEIVDEINKL